MNTWSQPLAVFDLETTGVDVVTARIVTAYLGTIDATGRVVTSRQWLLDPGIEIPERASAVHGISTQRARAEGMPAAEGVRQIVAAVRESFERGLPLVVYNAPYDLTLLESEARRHGVAALVEPAPVIDPLVIDRAVDKYRRGKRTLTAAAEHYGVTLDGAHDAGQDALAAGRVVQAIARAFPAELDVTAPRLHALQRDWCRAQTEDFVAYMRRVKDPEFSADGDWPVRTRVRGVVPD